MSPMTDAELMALSRLYHQNQDKITVLLLNYLSENSPRITSAMFGVPRSELENILEKNKVTTV